MKTNRICTPTPTIAAPQIIRKYRGARGPGRHVYIVSGPVDSGKSSAAREIITAWRAQGLTVGGIIAQAHRDAAGKKTAYFAEDVRSGVRRPLVALPTANTAELTPPSATAAPPTTRAPHARKQTIGPFRIFPAGFRFARTVIKQEARTCQAICLDEIGPLELRGGGHARAVRWLVRRYPGTLLLVIRDSVYEKVIDRFRLQEPGYAVTIYHPPHFHRAEK